MEILQKLLISNVSCEDYYQNRLVLNALHDFVSSLNNPISKLLASDHFAKGIDSLVHRLLVKVCLYTSTIVITAWSATIEPIEAYTCLIESNTVAHASARASLSSSRKLPLRPCHDDRVANIDFHTFNPEKDRV